MNRDLHDQIDRIKGDIDELSREFDPDEVHRRYMAPIEANLSTASTKLEMLVEHLDLDDLEARLSDLSESMSELKSELAEVEQGREKVYYGRVIYTYQVTARNESEAWNIILGGAAPVVRTEKIGLLAEEQ